MKLVKIRDIYYIRELHHPCNESIVLELNLSQSRLFSRELLKLKMTHFSKLFGIQI